MMMVWVWVLLDGCFVFLVEDVMVLVGLVLKYCMVLIFVVCVCGEDIINVI